ncbi:LysR family transcriptional regulator [Nocardia sp. CA2R105]|uniref:LysR family transcriptional regulator n=1 Tax=Nocardia coffeae TaxID=2873381 RepID=UPI001CA7238A|nr:LysR family transcriptional regulator [Nocardia coffeae]MBY8862293.1 LysR family transcriptional regulator [Nocardia coffeae]
MDIRQLTAFVTVAEVGSVTRAAELLNSIQPSVTRQIQALEQELGVELFERTRYGMTPTTAGIVMADRARRALQELGRARAEIGPLSRMVSGGVTVGVLDSVVDLLSATLIATVLRDHPGIHLRVMTGGSGSLRRWMNDGDLDLALTSGWVEESVCRKVSLATEQLWVAAPPDAGLRADAPVSFRELADHPMVMPSPGDALRELIDIAAADLGVNFRIAVTTNSIRLQKQLVAEGQGWTVLPGVHIDRDILANDLSAAPLRAPEVRRSIVLVVSPAGRRPAAVAVVAEELARLVRSVIHDGRWLSGRPVAADIGAIDSGARAAVKGAI